MATQKSGNTFSQVMKVMLPDQGNKVVHKTASFGEVRGKKTHGGVDFNYEGGQAGINLTHPKVMSPVAGKVVYATGGKYGTVKIVDKNGFSHEILHLHTRTVKEGQLIKVGDQIGTMGATGGKHQHVHYQIKQNGKALNVEQWWNERAAPVLEKTEKSGQEASKAHTISEYRAGAKAKSKSVEKTPSKEVVEIKQESKKIPAKEIVELKPEGKKTPVKPIVELKPEGKKVPVNPAAKENKPAVSEKTETTKHTINEYRNGAKSNSSPAKTVEPVKKTEHATKTEQMEFLKKFIGEAKGIEKLTGLPASFILGKISLETGWAKKELLKADGTTSYNLFNIKAYSTWGGEKLTALVSETVGGKKVSMYQDFRVFKNHAEAFEHYGKIMVDDKRYASLKGLTDPVQIADAMKKYATDPNYAKQLVTVYKQVNNALLKLEATGEIPKGSAVPVAPKKTADWQYNDSDFNDAAALVASSEANQPAQTGLLASVDYNVLSSQNVMAVSATTLPKLADLLGDNQSLDYLLPSSGQTVGVPAGATTLTSSNHALQKYLPLDEFFA